MPYDVSGFSPIDTSGIRLQESHNPMSTSSGFEDVLGKIGMGLGAMGPAMDAGMQYAGWNRGASITSAAVMGLTGGGGGFSTPGMGMAGGPKFNAWGGAPGPAGGNGKFLSPPGAPPGFSPGGGMPMGSPGAPPGMGGGMPSMFGGATDTGSMDSQINAMFNNNMVFLAMQTKVQNISQITQMTSNIAKADSDAKLNAIRNIRS